MSVNLTVSAAPHIRGKDNTRRLMLDVLIALAPALIAAVYFYGERALVLTVISVAACVVCEALICLVMRRPVSVGDLSAVVTGVLLAFSVPHSCPYWALVAGDAFAIIVVKGLVGGLGQNVFNPALAGRAFMMLLWPSTITRYGYTYVAPFEFGTADIVASSTPLQTMARSTLPDVSIFDMFLGNGVLGCIGEVCNLALLIGLAWLLYRKVISWRIPVAYLGAVAVLTLVLQQGRRRPGLDALQRPWRRRDARRHLHGHRLCHQPHPARRAARLRHRLRRADGRDTLLRHLPEGVTYAILIMNACAWAFDKAFPIRRFGVVKGGAGK